MSVLDEVLRADDAHASSCGMEFFTNEAMGALLARSLETAESGPEGFHDTGAGPGSAAGEGIDRLTPEETRP